MAWDSAYTAQLTSGFQGMAMNNMAMSQQIGMAGNPLMTGGGAQQYGNQVMGWGMNRAQAIGGPLMAAGLGMMGLDPLSIGMRAGMATWGAGGGLMSAGLAGMGAAGLAAAPMMAAQYAGGQMFTGAQQQQQLNQAMGQSFQFFNPMTGGQGFNTPQLSQIGGMMRSMTHEFGPRGEVVGMGELTSLAAGMGQMGMATQVRDVQEFGRKFREMVSTLKTVATELGTSLQEAQGLISGMRSSGIFRTSDQLKMVSQMKGTAFAGNLALSEVSAMGNIGSQISRSVGGLGRQGMTAGMRTIGQIGVAQQMGVLSEEDIYNVTGLTGAEGRQALATSSLQHSARFLGSMRGRRMLASLADEDGSLDQGAVQRLLNGGMGISETLTESRSNLGRVGRANFLRNEGRLRGAAMEQIGGFLPALQLRQWAESRGINVNEMDDRSMLFAQRHLGMGRDEMDVAVRMAQQLPGIAANMKLAGEEQRYVDQVAGHRKDLGIEGVKNRFAQAREKVQGSLQKIGQDIFNEGTNMIERWANRLAGTYEERFSREALAAVKGAGMGSEMAQGQMERLLFTKSGLGGGGGGLFGETRSSQNFFRDSKLDRFLNAAEHPLLGGLSGVALGITRGESMSDRYKKAGYDLSDIASISDTKERDTALRQRLAEIGNISSAASRPPSAELLALGSTNAGWLQNAFMSEAVAGKKGEARLQALGDAIEKNGSAELKARWAQARTPAERAQLASALRGGAAGGSDASSVLDVVRNEAGLYSAPGGGLFMSGANMTEYDKARYLEQNMGAGAASGSDRLGNIVKNAGALDWAAMALIPGYGGTVANEVASREQFAGHTFSKKGMGDYLRSDEASKRFTALHDPRSSTEAMRSLREEVARLREGGREADLSKAYALAAMGASADLASGADLQEVATKWGYESSDILEKDIARIRENEGEKRAKRRATTFRTEGREGMRQLQGLSAAGVGSFDFESGKVSLSKEFLDRAGIKTEGRDKNDPTLRFLRARVGAAGARASLDTVDPTNEEASRAAVQKVIDKEREQYDALAGMSVRDLRELAKKERAALDFEGADMLDEVAGRRQKFDRTASRFGRGVATAEGLGIALSRKDKMAMRNAGQDPASRKALIAKFEKELGISAEDREAFGKDMEAVLSGKKGADVLQGISQLPSVQKAQEEKRQKSVEQADPGAKMVKEAITQLGDKLSGKLGEVVEAVGNLKDAEK